MSYHLTNRSFGWDNHNVKGKFAIVDSPAGPRIFMDFSSAYLTNDRLEACRDSIHEVYLWYWSQEMRLCLSMRVRTFRLHFRTLQSLLSYDSYRPYPRL